MSSSVSRAVALMLVCVGFIGSSKVVRTQEPFSASGGGWIAGLAGGRATFGLSAGFHNDQLKGHVVFMDRSIGFALESTEFTLFQVSGTDLGCLATIQGYADTTEAADVPFAITVNDQAADSFSLVVDGYVNLNVPVQGGSIQVRGVLCP